MRRMKYKLTFESQPSVKYHAWHRTLTQALVAAAAVQMEMPKGECLAVIYGPGFETGLRYQANHRFVKK